MEKPLHAYLQQGESVQNNLITVLLYSCESWVISKAMENKISSFGTSCYRIMLNIERNQQSTKLHHLQPHRNSSPY